jgi:peptidyl-dipeptidase A
MIRKMNNCCKITTLIIALGTAGCASSEAGKRTQPAKNADAERQSGSAGAKAAAGKTPTATMPTLADAKAFIEDTEKKLLRLWIDAERAWWVKSNFITHDTSLVATEADQRLMAFVAERATRAAELAKLDLPTDLRRKFDLLRSRQNLPAPKGVEAQQELASLASKLSSIYGKGKVCSETLGRALVKLRGKKAKVEKCLALGDLTEIMAKSRNADHLLEAWVGWRKISLPMRKLYRRYAELANEGAKYLGFSDLSDLWKSRYDMPAQAFETEVDRLWQQVSPLYQDLHCYARRKLQGRYGKKLVADGQPIPAHLLGNMWSQDWTALDDLLLPKKAKGVDLDKALKKKGIDEVGMVKVAEAFFTSLGLAALPETFWKRSLFTKPKDRDVVCHASAWDVDFDEDLRIKMCIRRTGEDLTVIHHELGHNYYQYYYRKLDPLFRDSANDGFHEGLGDTIALSVTPSYLKEIGLIKKVPKNELAPLLQRAMDKVAFLPFGILVDKWRWDIFSGKVKADQYNKHWWELRRKFQGIAPPQPRSEADFDPGAKYHIPGNVPYARYFLAAILQFQFHRALCRISEHKGPLHTCSIFNNKKAGKRLKAMMEMGLAQPWPKALEALTGESKMDATAMLSYFAPLQKWLKEENKGQTCGW